jgi:hypothetical protein
MAAIPGRAPSRSRSDPRPLIEKIGGAARLLTDIAAARIAPPAQDTKFLQDHVVGYRQSANLHVRNLASGWLNKEVPVKALASNIGQTNPLSEWLYVNIGWGVTPFADLQPTVTREIMLPQDGKPATLTYSVSNSVASREADKLRLQPKIRFLHGGREIAKSEVYHAPMAIGEVGKVAGEASATWNLSGRQAQEIRASRGASLPELGLFRSDSDPVVDEVKGRFEYTRPAQD